HLFESLEHQHMGEPARRAATEGQADARARGAHALPARVSRFRLGRRRLRGGECGGGSLATTAGSASVVWLARIRASWRFKCSLAGAAAASTFLKRWKSST